MHLDLDVTANCICEIRFLALDGFDPNAVHQLSSKDEKSQQSRDSKPGLLGGKQECFLCAMQPPPPKHLRTLYHWSFAAKCCSNKRKKKINEGKISQHSCRPRISCDVIDFIKSRCSRNSWNRRRSEPNISGSDSPPLARRKKKDLRYDFSPFLAALGFTFSGLKPLLPKALLPKALLPKAIRTFWLFGLFDIWAGISSFVNINTAKAL